MSKCVYFFVCIYRGRGSHICADNLAEVHQVVKVYICVCVYVCFCICVYQVCLCLCMYMYYMFRGSHICWQPCWSASSCKGIYMCVWVCLFLYTCIRKCAATYADSLSEVHPVVKAYIYVRVDRCICDMCMCQCKWLCLCMYISGPRQPHMLIALLSCIEF